jgi:signal transduction histidine kinase
MWTYMSPLGARTIMMGSPNSSPRASEVSTRRASWLAWSLAAAGLAMLAAGAAMVVINSDAVGSNETVIVLFGSCAVIGALAVSRQPRNFIGWLFLTSGVVTAPQVLMGELAILLYNRGGPLTVIRWLAWPNDWVWVVAFGPLLTLLPLLFPDGRPPSRRWRPLAWLAACCIAFLAVGSAIAPGRFDKLPVENPAGVGPSGSFASLLAGLAFVAAVACCVLCVCSLFFRYRHADGDERQQVKWFGLGVAFTLTCVLAGGVAQGLGVQVVSDVLGAVGVLGVPVGAAIAILRFRLFDVDVVISKAIVYGTLAVFISIVYAGLVAGVGQLAGSVGTPTLSAIAAAIVALAFQPVRRRMQRFANRLVYGQRATPYEVLSDFSDRVASAYSTEDILPRMAQIVAAGTGAARAEVWLRVGAELRSAARWPPDGTASPNPVPMPSNDLPAFGEDDAAFPVVHHGEMLGAIVVQAPASDPITADKEKLIVNLAAQAGLVLRNVRLLEDIRASRQRIVTAQDAAARRLERNIHDGAQQQLVALAVKTSLADSLVGHDDAEAHQMLAQIQAEIKEALQDLRDLARGIYPPLLADLGLVAALQAQARKSALPAVIEGNGLSRYPQEAETAVYFCALEALQNVAKYAQASRAVVRLSGSDSVLAFTVEDDGVGFDPSAQGYGTGIQGMSDRLAALGGELRVTSAPGTGTLIEGSVPVNWLRSTAPH